MEKHREEIRQSFVDTICNVIAEYNPTLAAMFRKNPFNRKAYAEAFACGFKDKTNYVATSVIEMTDDLLSIHY